jgi:hypothetical protein
MKPRRITLWILSVGFGFAATAGTILAFGSSYDRFWTNFLFKGDLPLLLVTGYWSLAFIWLDWVLRTEYLKT